MMSESPIFTQIADGMDMAVHAIVRRRRMYPDEAFQIVNYHNVPIILCRHPRFCEHVRMVCEKAVDIMRGSQLNAVLLTFYCNGLPLERHWIECWINEKRLRLDEANKARDVFAEAKQTFVVALNNCMRQLDSFPAQSDASTTDKMFFALEILLKQQDSGNSTSIKQRFHVNDDWIMHRRRKQVGKKLFPEALLESKYFRIQVSMEK